MSVDESVVRMKAFELWQARGCPIGSPEQDWFSAKRVLEAASARPTTNAESEPLGLRVSDAPESANAKNGAGGQSVPMGLRMAEATPPSSRGKRKANGKRRR